MAEDTIVDAGEHQVSKESFDKLKAERAAEAEEMAKLRAFKNTHDQKQRDVIAKLQPDIASFVNEIVKSNSDHASEMDSIAEWSRGCHESRSLDTAMPLARFVSCASATFKRTREEASSNAEKASTLGNTMKDLETVTADRDSKAKRIAELEDLCNERQTAMSKLQEQLAQAGVLKDKFDFSKLSSREANCSAEAAKETPTAALTQVTSVASRGVVEDELMSFVGGFSSVGTHRINQSGTAHAHLGATTGSVESEIEAAIRGVY